MKFRRQKHDHVKKDNDLVWNCIVLNLHGESLESKIVCSHSRRQDILQCTGGGQFENSLTSSMYEIGK